MRQRWPAVASLALVALLVGACAPSEGEAIASRISAAKDPAITDVRFHRENYIDPEEINVYVAPGTSTTEAARIWCEVVAPAGGGWSQEHPAFLMDEKSHDILVDEPACSTTPPG